MAEFDLKGSIAHVINGETGIITKKEALQIKQEEGFARTQGWVS